MLILMNKGSRSFSLLLILLVVVMVTGALGFYWVHKKDIVNPFSSNEWIQYPGAPAMEGLTFQFPSDWKVQRQGTNRSDEDTSVVRVWKGEEQILFIYSNRASLVPGCNEVTGLVYGTSETIKRIFSSAKCPLYSL